MSMRTFLILVASSAGLMAQPPAQGPLAPVAADNPSELQIRLMVDFRLRQTIGDQLAQINQELANPAPGSPNEDVRATVVAKEFKPFQPYMTQTQYFDQPNSRYLNMPYILEFEVKNIKKKVLGGFVPYPWTRKVTVSLNVGIFCDRWETGVGELVAHNHADPPYLDSDPSLSEEVVNAFLGNWLIPRVDSRLRSALQWQSIASENLNLPCNQMGFTPGPVEDLRQGILSYKLKTARIQESLLPRISVKLVQIKRLQARNQYNQPIYYPIETPTLTFYAGHALAFEQLPSIAENQVLSLAGEAALSVPMPGSTGSLVIIANLAHGLGNLEDSAFLVFSQSSNFGQGRRTIILNKTYTMPPQLPLRPKPIKVQVPAYEITFDVSVPNTVLTRF